MTASLKSATLNLCPVTGRGAALAGRKRRHARGVEAGFSLTELVVVVALIIIVAGLAFRTLSGRDDSVRLGQDVTRRIRERRAAAIQLNQQRSASQLEQFVQPPVTRPRARSGWKARTPTTTATTTSPAAPSHGSSRRARRGRPEPGSTPTKAALFNYLRVGVWRPPPPTSTPSP